MALTSEEKKDIVSAVLSSLQTNSKSIIQLTPVQNLSDNDYFEIKGGKRVSYGVLRVLIERLIESGDNSLKTLIRKCENAIIEIAEKAETAQLTANDAQKIANSAKRVTDSKGRANGIAPLNANGKIDAEFLPDLKDVVFFDRFVQEASLATSSSGLSSSSLGAYVVYVRSSGSFALYDSKTGSYYGSWMDGASFGAISGFGVIPKASKLYVCREVPMVYLSKNGSLVPLGNNIDDKPDDKPGGSTCECGPIPKEELAEIISKYLGVETGPDGGTVIGGCNCQPISDLEIEEAAVRGFS